MSGKRPSPQFSDQSNCRPIPAPGFANLLSGHRIRKIYTPAARIHVPMRPIGNPKDPIDISIPPLEVPMSPITVPTSPIGDQLIPDDDRMSPIDIPTSSTGKRTTPIDDSKTPNGAQMTPFEVTVGPTDHRTDPVWHPSSLVEPRIDPTDDPTCAVKSNYKLTGGRRLNFLSRAHSMPDARQIPNPIKRRKRGQVS